MAVGVIAREAARTVVQIAALPGAAHGLHARGVSSHRQEGAIDKRFAGLTVVATQGQVANFSMQVACPVAELKEPAQPFRPHDWGVPQVFDVGLQRQVAYFPLHVAYPSASKLPAQPPASHDA